MTRGAALLAGAALAAGVAPPAGALAASARCTTNGGLSSCLKVTNGGNGPAFRFRTAGTRGGTITVGKGGNAARPFTTNATGVATGLNADAVDGMSAADIIREARAGLPAAPPALDATAFLPARGKAVDADLLDGLDATQFLRASAKAADADKLDGQDASAFLGASAKAADADRLDGLDASAFLGASAKAADADRLDGLDATEFVSAASLLRVARQELTIGDPAAMLLNDAGVQLEVECVDVGGSPALRLTAISADAGTWVTASRGSGGAAAPAAVPSGTTGTTFYDHELTGGSNDLDTLTVSLSKLDGTTFIGSLVVGLGIQGDDCSVAGSWRRV